jgi:hypothetical protein
MGSSWVVEVASTSEYNFSGFVKNRHFIFDPTEIKKLRFVNVIVKCNL